MRTWLALCSILLGAIVFLIANPTTYGFVGYLFALLNLLAAALYAVYVKFVINTIKPSTMDLVLYNNLLSLPLLLCFLWIDNVSKLGADFADIPTVQVELHGAETPGWVWLLLSMFVAGTISFAGFGLARAVTATTNTVCQHVSKIVSMLISVAVLQTVFTPMMWGAAAITFAGTAWYSYERTRESRATHSNAHSKTEDSSLIGGEPPAGRGCFPCAC